MASSNTIRRKYDVFLSFRGEDVRGEFLENLYRTLRQKGILTFRDDDKLKDGKGIKDALYKAIEESSLSIVVLSKNYANSSWCLDELAHILLCKRTTEHAIYPVFYHVTPSEVRKIGGEFGVGFATAASANEGKIEKWTKALTEVADLKGWAYPHVRFETAPALIDNLVHKIFIRTIDTYPIRAQDLVGIKFRMTEVIKLLDLGLNEPRIVGLLGMGAIGKTTLARVVYDSISWQFEGCSFIDNVTEVITRSGILTLQKHLISDTLMERDLEVRSVMHGTNIIQNMVCRKKVLIVLDDVSEPKQLENLIMELHFSPESRIIITTRNQQVLTVCGVNDVFHVQPLSKPESIELFKSKAFGKNGNTEEFMRLIGPAVQYANGVPLALKVLGSFLLGGTVPEWESALARLKECPDEESQRVLKISYDGLHPEEKEIFLDITCFFIGMLKDRVIKILDSCGFNPDFGINVLVKKSLLTISDDNVLVMHDLIQKMGWSIVDEESRKVPGERSRLWRLRDVKDVVMENTGTNKVEGILFYPENLQPRPNAFAKMTNLRILMIHGAWCSIDLSDKLRLLFWHGYPLKSMPSSFQPENLVELCLTNSHIEQLWDKKVVLPKLASLDLRHSTSLTNSPDFTGFPNLEDLIFEGCTALGDLHPSVKYLRRLKILNLKGCTSLCSLPYGIESQCFHTLIFSGCWMLMNILERFGDLKQLGKLNLDGTRTAELPQTIGNSTNLYHLDLSGCTDLKSLPSSIGQLKKLKQLLLNGCYSLSELPYEVGHIDSLEILDVSLVGSIPALDLPGSTFTLSTIGQLEELKRNLLNGIINLRKQDESFEFVDDLEVLDVSSSKFMPFPQSFLGYSITSNIIVPFKKIKQLLLNWYYNFRKLHEEVGPTDNLENPNVCKLMKLANSIEPGSTSITIGHLKTIRKFTLDGHYSPKKLLAELGGIQGVECIDVSFPDDKLVASFARRFNIPRSIGQLKKLKQLLLFGCTRLGKLPEEVGLIDSLEVLDVSFTGITQLPASVERLRNLKKLGIKGCKRITPPSFSGFESLRMLDLAFCSLKAIPGSISICLSLKTLLLSENKFKFLPASIKNLINLEKLFINECKKLQELPELPFNTRDVIAYGCKSLETICSPTVYKDARRLCFACCPKLVGNEGISTLMEYNFLFNQIKENKRRSSRVYIGPGSKIPEWINYKNAGGSLEFHLPIHDLNAFNLLGFTFSAVVKTKDRDSKIGWQMRIGEKIFNFGEFFRFSKYSKNVIVLFLPTRYFTIDDFHMGGTTLEFCFVASRNRDKRGFYTTEQELQPAPEVKECGVRLIYKEEIVNDGQIVEVPCTTFLRPRQNIRFARLQSDKGLRNSVFYFYKSIAFFCAIILFMYVVNFLLDKVRRGAKI